MERVVGTKNGDDTRRRAEQRGDEQSARTQKSSHGPKNCGPKNRSSKVACGNYNSSSVPKNYILT